ncbi:unnamed protein product [Sphagnum balticum]
MARDAAAAAAGGGEMVAERRPSFVQDCKEAGFVKAYERQWHRTVAHAKAFPYLRTSYFYAAPSGESSPEAAKGASEQSAATRRTRGHNKSYETEPANNSSTFTTASAKLVIS